MNESNYKKYMYINGQWEAVSDEDDQSSYTKQQVDNIALGLGNTLGISIDSQTYIMTLTLKHNNTILSTGTVDLPLESVVVNGSYDSTNKKLILTLQNGNTVDIPIGDLIDGLVDITTFNNGMATKVDKVEITRTITFSGDISSFTNIGDYSTFIATNVSKDIDEIYVNFSGDIFESHLVYENGEYQEVEIPYWAEQISFHNDSTTLTGEVTVDYKLINKVAHITDVNKKQDRFDVSGHLSLINNVLSTDTAKCYPAVFESGNISTDPEDYPGIQWGDFAIELTGDPQNTRVWVQKMNPTSTTIYWHKFIEGMKVYEETTNPPTNISGTPPYKIGQLWVKTETVNNETVKTVYMLINMVDDGQSIYTLTWKNIFDWYTKNEIDTKLIDKQDKTNITTDTTSTTVSLTLADNHEYRYTQDLTSLTLTMPSGDFISSIVFASGSTPTSMTYDSNIKWSGDDVTNGQFVPSADKDYDICLYYNGLNVNGIVRGV